MSSMMEKKQAPPEDKKYELVCSNSRLNTKKAKLKRLHRKTDKSVTIIEDIKIFLSNRKPRKNKLVRILKLEPQTNKEHPIIREHT